MQWQNSGGQLNKTQSYVDTFFNWFDASDWVTSQITDYGTWQDADDWIIHELEIKLMPSGGYRAGIVFSNKQMELNV